MLSIPGEAEGVPFVVWPGRFRNHRRGAGAVRKPLKSRGLALSEHGLERKNEIKIGELDK
jgi:hypothetical protein